MKKEVIIGIVSVISLFILYFGINHLKGVNIFKPTNHYYVRFKNIPELQSSSNVFVDGFKIGIVSDISYDYDSWDNIIVQISLNKSMKIQSGSYVELSSSFTTGGSLHLMLNKHVTTFCAVGDTIDGRPKLGMMEKVSDELLPQVVDLIPKIDSILSGLDHLMRHPALVQSLNHIERTTYNLERTTAQLSKVMDNDIPEIVSDFKSITSDISMLTLQTRQMDLEGTYKRLNETMDNLQQVSLKLNQKDNNLGLLLNDRALYDHLNMLTNEASSLLVDIQKDPKKYVKLSIF